MVLNGVRVKIFRGRSLQDWRDGLAYSLYLINKGRIGSRAEREYIDSERASRQYRRMSSAIKEFKFEDDDEDCLDDEEITVDTYKNNSKVASGLSMAINDVAGDDMAENLLGRNISSERRSSISSQSSVSSSVSVTPRADGRNSFKYKCCSICLTDFESGIKVKVVPNCGHTFHGECLEQWLTRQFRCPNC